VARGFGTADGGRGQRDFEDEAVLVVIDEHAPDVLEHAGGFAFFPKAAAGTRPVVGESGGHGEAQGFGVHHREHQHLARIGVEGDAGDAAVVVEFRGEFIAFLDLLYGDAWGKMDHGFAGWAAAFGGWGLAGDFFRRSS